MSEPSTYWLDARDRIVWFDDGFRAFAEANGCPDLPESVLGRPLLDFVSGLPTCRVLGHLLERARLGGTTLRLPYRCDSPAERRHMELEVEPLSSGELEMRSRLLRTERRLLPFVTAPPPSGRTVEVCSWCNRVRAEDWLEAEAAIRALRLMEEPDPPAAAHGLCETCQADLVGAPAL